MKYLSKSNLCVTSLLA